MNRMKWIFLAATALTLGSCSSEQADLEGQQVELRLASSLDLQTRAAYTFTQNTQIASGETVYAWVDEVGASEYIHAWQLTADGSGNFTGDPKNYPMSGRAIDVYALHGNFTGITPGTTTFPSTLTHTVATDQSTGSNYESSDLLSASAKNCARQVEAHNLQFSHLLSKVEVYLVAGTGMTDAELATAQVTILNTKLSATLTLSKTAAALVSVAPSGTIDATTANAIAAKMQSQTDQTVTIEGTAQKAYAFGEAVIVPQIVSSTGAAGGAAVDFIVVEVGTSTYTAQVSGEFVAGKRYVYNVIVNKSGITLTSTILPWGEGGTQVITAK